MAVSGDALATLPRLRGAQADASNPASHVWLSASAGTGKTQVLAARVFRLLLRGVDPGAILCLTFTKAGAAEMAQRINGRLAAWVRMPDSILAKDLDALGESTSEALRGRARTLFAKVLDAPGGGLRIQTIHGFCQGLLAAFPVEAGLTPGFRPLEAREEAGLAREALASMLSDAEREGRERPVEIVGRLSLRMGEGGAEAFLLACARALPALEALPVGIQPWLRRELGLPSGDIDEAIAEWCDALDLDAIARIAAANRAWGTATGQAAAATVQRWLDSEDRAATLDELASVVLTGTGTQRKASKKLIDAEPDYEILARDLGEACTDVLSMVQRATYCDLLADGLEVGRDYARGYALAKRRAGAVDFDDLIATTVALLDQPGIGEWVRYKLDQATEHLLIDEAQDTNGHQWRIVRALADEFFVGRGIYAPSTRTLFTVGDYKQAIFGFQGTDPRQFEAAQISFSRRAEEAFGDDDWPENERGLPLSALSLTHSFRSTLPVLEFVDAAIEAIGEPGLGIETTEPHASEVAGPGTVTLWPPVSAGGSEDDEEGWVDDAVRKLASDIARAVKGWLAPDAGLMLESKGRRLRPEDVMILVKRRGDLASLIVARLYAEGVPVAGVDRLRLNAPLAVQDLLATIRFVLQPEDDLSVAALLVSPLIGWTQDELMAAAPREAGPLWRHLQRTQPATRLAPLLAMLARADIATPYQFLEELLSGPLDGRRKLIRRLGTEARDPIEELLNAALTFESTTTPSLQRFLDWFDRGDVEIVRDPSAPLDAVRVMTAHGAKGLQAPLVILADATADPSAAPRSILKWAPEPGAAPIPVFRPRSSERGGPLDAVVSAAEQRELEEHWRLFYVAATRAEERLVIAGALGPRAKGVPPENSWYAASDRALTALDVPITEGARTFAGVEPQPAVIAKASASVEIAANAQLPGWAHEPAPQEARPPRPLSPSALGDDAVSDPPPTPAMRVAAERGRLIHALFERLPAVAATDRATAADRWLAKAGGVDDVAARSEIVQSVVAVLDDPRFAELFSADTLAEAPIAATLANGMVVSGTVDRLLIESDRIRVVDFKTGRRAPRGLDDVPEYHLKQMAAYAEALSVIFPGRSVEAALLYTAGPRLIVLDDETLAANKPHYRPTEQS
ncbi:MULTISPECIES: double-strand break repair helicase AddA [unclassified Sphingomonas]|uniref:double-strand break repair helicase AddA n=1 Tax=unclassified Sphingomonas TaxID=196159 RepID=UPI000FF2F6D2|nr:MULTISPECIES: double-strand break repair helicase AddA [unclassified Sphingomonas]RKE50241.1 DNA helicase/exodeoxyribonuclease V subunit A [Sphingomonas sp. PP-CC-1A-547]TCM08576.1 DNA helicase/exodeoxyribonuclease V subunit A [Sphingomonas sp. PP-CC-3G-468]